MEPEEGELKNIYLPRLWREYKKQTGHYFSCGKLLDCNGPCHFCKIDFIILEEMTHFGNAWNNWGNSVFISNSMCTIMTRGEIATKFLSEIYMKCMAICEPMHFMGMSVNQWNIYHTEERITEPPASRIYALDMEQPDYTFELCSSGQNQRMQEWKIHSYSPA